MVVGTREVKKLEKELEESPLLLCGEKMKKVTEYTYLGTIISSEGVSESVLASVKSKVGKVKQMIYEIKVVLDDCRNMSPGGFMTALTIWEAAVTPYLYNSACCWLETPQAALSLLDSLQVEFMRVMLQTPRTTPVVSMYWDLGAPLAVNRIIDYKVRFYYHLLHLSKESIAFTIFDNQRKNLDLLKNA